MYWPNFEHDPLKPDGMKIDKKRNKLVYTYTMDTWNREHVKNYFKELVQVLPEDLDEGPDFNSLAKKDEDDSNEST